MTDADRGPWISIGLPRADGKIPTRITYAGSPNAFGGFYPSRSYNKLYTQDQIDAWLESFPKVVPTYTHKRTF